MSNIDADLLGAMADDAQAEARVTIPENTETKPEDVSAREDTELVGDEIDYDRTPWDDREHSEDVEPSQTDTDTETNEETDTETKTNTENSEDESEAGEADAETGEESTDEYDVNAWLQSLPPAPTEFTLTAPQFDEDGIVTNMTGEEFLKYTVERSKYESRVESYNNTAINRALDEAEKILPQIKTDPGIREMVENQYVAKTVNGQSYNLVAAAADVKKLIGGFKAEGAQNAKVHITRQKVAAVESPSNQRKSDTSKVDAIAKRLKSGDRHATEDLFALWLEDGKI